MAIKRLPIFMILMFAILLGSASAAWHNASSNLSNKLIAYFNMSEASGDLIDVFGGNNVAQLGTPNSSFGKIELGRSGFGDNTLFYDETWLAHGYENFSVSFWIFVYGTKGGNQYPFIYGEGTNNFKMSLYINEGDTPDTWRFEVAKDGVAGYSCIVNITSGYNRWYHVVGTSDKNKMAFFYVDGSQACSVLLNQATVSSGGDNLYIAGYPGGNYEVNGVMDEFGVWDKNLTEQDISNLYNGGAGLRYEPYGPAPAAPAAAVLNDTKLYLTMNSNNATNVVDQSIYGMNVTVSGATWTSSGKYAGAYAFDGVDDYINVSNKFDYQSYTWSWWEISYYTGAQVSSISNMGYDFGGCQIGRTTSASMIMVCANGTGGGTGDYISWNRAITVSSGWTHFVLTMQNANATLYENGVSQGSYQFPFINYTDTKNLYIGRRFYPGSGTWFNGIIDEVRIWNYALNASTIMQIYNKTYAQFNDISENQTFVISKSVLQMVINNTILKPFDTDYNVNVTNVTAAGLTYGPGGYNYTRTHTPNQLSTLGPLSTSISVNDTFGNFVTNSLNYYVYQIDNNFTANQVFSNMVKVNVTAYFGSGVTGSCTIGSNESCLAFFSGSCIVPLWDSCPSVSVSNLNTIILNCTPSYSNTEKKMDLWTSCTVNGKVYNGSKTSVWVDNIAPAFTEDRFDRNGQAVRTRNLTGQFNLTDSNIFRINITLDGVSIYDVININNSVWNYTLNRRADDLAVGSHLFVVDAWDAHTAAAIEDYEVSRNILSNELKFTTDSNEITIKAVDEGFTIINPWQTEKAVDRYTFDYFPKDIKQETYSFEVETEQQIYIVNKPQEKWKVWLVSGNNWIDFYQELDPDVVPTFTQTAWNKVTVEVPAPKVAIEKEIAFSSVGDLNHVQVFYTFYTYNLSMGYLGSADEGEFQSVTLQILNSTTLSTYQAGFWLNGTSQFPWIAQNGTTIILNSTFRTPEWNVTAIVQNHWQLNYSGEVNDLYFNQTNARAAIDDCSIYNITSLVFDLYNEDFPTARVNGSLEFKMDYWITDKTRAKTFSSTKTNANRFVFCISNETQSFKADIYAIDTTDPGFAHRYYVFNGTVNATEQAFYLYNFNYTTGVSELQLTVRDYLTNKYIQGMVVQLQRLYLGEATWRTVQMDQADDFGLVIFNVLEQLEDYRLVFIDTNNTIYRTTNSMKFSCTSGLCQLTYQLDTSKSTQGTNEVYVAWAYSSPSSSVNMSWVDPLGGTNTVETSLVKYTYTGTTVLCNSSQTGAAGSVNCPTSGYTGTAFLKIKANDELVVSEFLDLNTSRLGDTMDQKEGAWWAGIIVLTCAMFGLISPAMGMITMFVGLVAVYLLGLFSPLTMTLVVVAALVGIAIGWKVRA